ncbi:Uncharacterised protein g1688 [Pycnogonum litorale]
MKNSPSLMLIYALIFGLVACHVFGQTFQYSTGWRNGKKRSGNGNDVTDGNIILHETLPKTRRYKQSLVAELCNGLAIRQKYLEDGLKRLSSLSSNCPVVQRTASSNFMEDELVPSGEYCNYLQ